MSSPRASENGDTLSAARRRVALAQAARANATREEIEARGIRPDLQQIIHHMNRAPSHTVKRARLSHSVAHRIYEDEDDDDVEDEGDKGKSTDEEEDEFEAQWQALIVEEGLQDANMFILAEFRQIARQRIRKLKRASSQWRFMCRSPKKHRFDMLASLCTCTELIVEVCKHLRPLDIVHVYSISRDFHGTINKHMRSSIFAWASHMAPTAARIYSSPVYCRWFVPDPDHRLVTRADRELSRTQPGQAKVEGQPPLNAKEGEVRMIPGLLWLQMAVNREIRARDIIACLARRGHRLPEGSHLTLKKMWLIMDAATTQARMMLLNNPDFFSNEDLYITQLFMVKLVLAFNDPVFGPQSSMLMRLMLGQRSLSPLWALLRGKKYRTATEIRQLKLRYDVGADQILDRNLPALHGVPVDELGTTHFEGWGTGPDHLMRPDELIPLEAARRQLDLDSCLEEMMIYGHVDFATGNSLVPSLDEMYMSDDDLSPAHKEWKPLKHELIHSGCGNVPFEPGMWLPKHARKARWKTLTDEEKAMILEAEQEEMDEIKQLDGARHKFDIAWANLANMVSHSMSKKKLMAKFKLLEPSSTDLADHLNQFAKPQRLRLANYDSADAMDIDSASPPASPVTAGAFNPFSALALRPAQHHHQHPPADVDDLSTIPDEDLTLDPIPASEVNRIINSFRRPHRPQSESDTDGETSYKDDDDDDDDGGNYPHNQQNHPDHQPQMHNLHPEPTSTNIEDDETEIEYLSTSSSSSEEEEEEEEQDNNENENQENNLLPPPQIYNVDPALLLHAPPTALSDANIDEMLLAQADEGYSDEESYEGSEDLSDGGDGHGHGHDREGEGEGRQQQQQQQQQNVDGLGEEMVEGMAVAGAEGLSGGVDWDHFLRNPGAYAVEGEGVVYAAAQEEDVDETEEEDVGEFGEDDDGDIEMEMDGDGGEDGQGDDEMEEDGNDAVNLLAGGGLQVTAQDQFQQVAQQMAEAGDDDELDLEDYVVDEDVGEDDRTRKLRDWFRPW